jgi:hypothetical protein
VLRHIHQHKEKTESGASQKETFLVRIIFAWLASSDMAESRRNLPDEFPYARCKFLAGRLMASTVTVARFPRNDSVPRKYARRWLADDLIESQKGEGTHVSKSLLESLRVHEDTEFKEVATGYDLWVCHRYQETSLYASSQEEVPPMPGNTIGISKVMITIFVGVRV